MSEQAESFKRDIKAILEKYGATTNVGEHYDQDENQCGETEYFVVDGEYLTPGDFFEG